MPARITLPQFAVLEALDSLGPLCQREISRKILKSSGNVTVVVTITEKGRDLLEDMLPGYMEALGREFQTLTQAEQAELGRLCRLLGRGHEDEEVEA